MVTEAGSAAMEAAHELGEISPIEEEKELVLAFKRGDDGSYQAIFQRYSPRVAGICRRMLEQTQDAEEAQQETFMKVFTSLPRFNGQFQLGAWVSRIATNVCLDHIRSKGRKPVDSTDQATLVDLSRDSADGPEEIFMKGDERQRVREVLVELAPMHRAALALREFEGMSYADIALALGMTEPQVKALIHRARRSFKKKWAHGLAVLLPWRLLARFRRFSSHYDAPHLGDAAASTANLASSCSAALQQCGVFVTDKIATTMTAVLVGTAAVSGAVSPGAHATPRGSMRAEVASRSTESTVGTSVQHKREKKEDTAETRRTAPVATDPEPDAEPQPESSASPAPADPAPAENEAPENDGSTAKPPANAGPAPFYTYFGWEGEQPIPRAQATSTSTQLDCEATSLTHSVESLISHGAFSYRVVVDVTVFTSGARLEFVVFKDNRDIRYSSRGAQPIATWATEGDRTRLEITGEYGAMHGYNPDGAKLPASGHFHATLTLDCATTSVITEEARFTTQ